MGANCTTNACFATNITVIHYSTFKLTGLEQKPKKKPKKPHTKPQIIILFVTPTTFLQMVAPVFARWHHPGQQQPLFSPFTVQQQLLIEITPPKKLQTWQMYRNSADISSLLYVMWNTSKNKKKLKKKKSNCNTFVLARVNTVKRIRWQPTVYYAC